MKKNSCALKKYILSFKVFFVLQKKTALGSYFPNIFKKDVFLCIKSTLSYSHASFLSFFLDKKDIFSCQ